MALFNKLGKLFKKEDEGKGNKAGRPSTGQGAHRKAAVDDVKDKPFPFKVRSLINPDAPMKGSLEQRENKILMSVSQKIRTGDYELPNLPSTSAFVLDMSNNPAISLVEMAKAIENDPVLSSELLKAANSVFYGGTQNAETLHQAVVRLGVRNLRALTLALSMKSVISKSRGLVVHAEEVWRQAISVAKIARRLAPVTAVEQDKAFLAGLLHNIGKVALIDMVGKSVSSGIQISRALLGKVFNRFHEEVGAAMAKKWNLPNEVVSVAGCHHNFMENKLYPRSAALVSLAQKMDLFLSMGSSTEYWGLVNIEEVEFLNINAGDCKRVFQESLHAFVEGTPEEESMPV